MNTIIDEQFWKNKKVFVTGHTGFKGSWLTLWLKKMGAEVTGYSLPPATQPNLYEVAAVESGINSIFGDINNSELLDSSLKLAHPEIIFHLAAQALVRESYVQPKDTFQTNVMGTINVLEAARNTNSVRAIVVVTSDKCYENKETFWSYRETDSMGGHDPYSASKGCAELVTSAYRNSFFQNGGVALASVRAGNVIGGGDWSNGRLVPDILNAIFKKEKLVVRNPNSTRPWQHVLEPLSGYLCLAQKLYTQDKQYQSGWNFGPALNDVQSVDWIINKLSEFCEYQLDTVVNNENIVHEANLLSLDSTKSKYLLGWYPIWDLDEALNKTSEWSKAFTSGKDMNRICMSQINEYMEKNSKD